MKTDIATPDSLHSAGSFPSPLFGLDHRSFVFWKTRIAAALNLWRSKTGEIVALDHMQECQKQVPDVYAAMVRVPPDQLSDWPNS